MPILYKAVIKDYTYQVEHFLMSWLFLNVNNSPKIKEVWFTVYTSVWTDTDSTVAQQTHAMIWDFNN